MRNKKRNSIVGLILLVAVGFFVYKALLIFKPFSQSEKNEQDALHEHPFTQPLVLSLSSTMKDKEGIPYSGVVAYNPLTETYSYIATASEGTITPFGSTSFSSGARYLAVRTSETGSELVIYNREKFAVERVVKKLASPRAVSFVAWSPTGETFAYMDFGATSLNVESVSLGSEAKAVPIDFPIGFSPDGSMLLARVGSTLATVRIEDGEQTPIKGVTFTDQKARFILSPSGKSLITMSDTAFGWYRVNWETKTISSAGGIKADSKFSDVVFRKDDTLLARDDNNIRLYAYQGDKGMVLSEVAKLALPEGAHILQLDF